MSFSGKYDDLNDPINLAVNDVIKKGVVVVAQPKFTGGFETSKEIVIQLTVDSPVANRGNIDGTLNILKDSGQLKVNKVTVYNKIGEKITSFS